MVPRPRLMHLRLYQGEIGALEGARFFFEVAGNVCCLICFKI